MHETKIILKWLSVCSWFSTNGTRFTAVQVRSSTGSTDYTVSSVTADSNAELKNSWQATLKTSRVSMAVVQVILLTSGKNIANSTARFFALPKICCLRLLHRPSLNVAYLLWTQSVNFSLQGDETEWTNHLKCVQSWNWTWSSWRRMDVD